MPITPFHFGPGAALHAIAPRQVSFLAFCAANVLIDLESLSNLVAQRYPVHAFFHTYVGATLIVVVTMLLFFAARGTAARVALPNLFEWKALRPPQVLAGAAAGAYSHVVLDSIMHADMSPLAPFSDVNPLLGAISLEGLHWFCFGGAVFALLVLGIRRLVGRGNDHGSA
ncbi:MAG TPA: hypothetical protein VEC06_19035 [Paucimonas sp.]|nr:hypothetical protein [Paucimonas sp.]